MEYVFPLAFGVHILSYCRSFLARRKHFRYKWLYTYLHSSIDRYTHARTHTYFREIFRKGGKRRMETQHGPVALLPFPVQTAGICFYHMWLLPRLPSLCLVALNPVWHILFCFLWSCSPSIYLSSYHSTSKASLSFYMPLSLCLFRH